MRSSLGWKASSITRTPLPPPGYVGPHRLNRTEYANAVRDLLALEVDPEALLPVDGAEDGFDNVANALTVSPSFIDQYLSAARNLSAQAVGNPAPRAVGVPYDLSDPRGQQFYVEGLPLGTRGGALIEHYFPSDGDYLLNIGDLVTGLWGYNQEHENTLIATLDGKKFFELDIGGGEDLKALDQIGAPAVDQINARLKRIPFTTTAGVHRVGVTFLHRSFAESDRQLHALVPGGGQDSVLTLNVVEIFGPVTPTGVSSTASRDKIFSCHPEDGAEEMACAGEIVTGLARAAFRGAFDEADVATLMRLYEVGSGFGGFEEGIKYALSGVLAHPNFLYRFEPVPDDLAAGALLSPHGSGACFAPLLLLVEHDPRCRVARGCRSRAPTGAGCPRSGKCGECWPILVRKPSLRTSGISGSDSASSTALRQIRLCSRTSTGGFVITSSPKHDCSSTVSSVKTAACWNCSRPITRI